MESKPRLAPLPRSLRRSSYRSTIALAVASAIILSVGMAALVGAGPASAGTRRGANRTTTTTSAISPATTVAPGPTTTVTAAPVVTTSPTTTVTATPTTTTIVAVSTTTAPKTATATTTTVPAPTSGSGTVFFGAATEGGPGSLSGLDTFETDAAKHVSLYVYYQSFAFDANFNSTAANAIRTRGATPMVTWEPWDPSSGSTVQPAYSLKSIASGAHDAYIGRWASQIKTWNQPLWLRFAHEMNGNWYPWAAGVNGNTAADYVAAWRHVHDIFVQAGATNVTWVWSPNVVAPGFTALNQLYPGDAYVDWMGVDGYNWGTTQSWGSTWQTPTEVFGATLANLRQLSSRPIVIAETASAEVGGNKAQWIQQFFSMLSANPDIKAFVWFNFNKETDWRIESSSTARSAFATGVGDPRYR